MDGRWRGKVIIYDELHRFFPQYCFSPIVFVFRNNSDDKIRTQIGVVFINLVKKYQLFHWRTSTTQPSEKKGYVENMTWCSYTYWDINDTIRLIIHQAKFHIRQYDKTMEPVTFIHSKCFRFFVLIFYLMILHNFSFIIIRLYEVASKTRTHLCRVHACKNCAIVNITQSERV